MEKRLSETIEIEVRFSEVDSMKVVWHGNYMQYFEDGREAFGRKYGLDYLTIYGQGYFVPVVDIAFHYRKPMEYGRKALLTVTYRPCEAAKILFDYEIKDSNGGIADNGQFGAGVYGQELSTGSVVAGLL